MAWEENLEFTSSLFCVNITYHTAILRVSADRAANRGAHTRAKGAVLHLHRPGLCETRTCMGVFLSSGFWFVAFLVWSGKAVPCPVACDQVRGARGKVSRDRNASAA